MRRVRVATPRLSLALVCSGCSAPQRVWLPLESEASPELQIIYAILDEDLGQGWHAYRTRPEQLLVVADWPKDGGQVVAIPETPNSSLCFRLISHEEYKHPFAGAAALLGLVAFPEHAFPEARRFYFFSSWTFSEDRTACRVHLDCRGGGCGSISVLDLSWSDGQWRIRSRAVQSWYSYE